MAQKTDKSSTTPQNPDLDAMPSNCWIVPEYSSRETIQHLQNQINSGYPYIDQTGFYIDPSSSSDWCKVERQKIYHDVRVSVSYDNVVDQICHFYDITEPTEELDIISLGPGVGVEESVLTQLLAKRFKNIRVFLVDVSDGLLEESTKNMNVVMQHYSNVTMCAVRGSYYQLWNYLPFLSPTKTKRKRLVMAFTILYNLQDELSFLHNNFIHFDENDLFLFDFFKCAAPAEYPDLVHQKELRLSSRSLLGSYDSTIDQWHLNILERYCKDFKSVEFGYKFSTFGCIIPGSYSVDKLAYIELKNQKDRTLIIQRYKRYPMESLGYTLQRQGWLPVNAWPFTKLQERVLYLFQRVTKY